MNTRNKKTPRGEALRQGEMFDASPVSPEVGLPMPAEMSARLWREIAGNEPFQLGNRRLWKFLFQLRLALDSQARAQGSTDVISRFHEINFRIGNRTFRVLATIKHYPGTGSPVLNLQTAQEHLDRTHDRITAIRAAAEKAIADS